MTAAAQTLSTSVVDKQTIRLKFVMIDLGWHCPQTKEIAADKVVFPWSTWPMVPMFT